MNPGTGENDHRKRIKPAGEWEQVELLCRCPEQRDYELIHPHTFIRVLVATVA